MKATLILWRYPCQVFDIRSFLVRLDHHQLPKSVRPDHLLSQKQSYWTKFSPKLDPTGQVLPRTIFYNRATPSLCIMKYIPTNKACQCQCLVISNIASTTQPFALASNLCYDQQVKNVCFSEYFHFISTWSHPGLTRITLQVSGLSGSVMLTQFQP